MEASTFLFNTNATRVAHSQYINLVLYVIEDVLFWSPYFAQVLILMESTPPPPLLYMAMRHINSRVAKPKVLGDKIDKPWV